MKTDDETNREMTAGIENAKPARRIVFYKTVKSGNVYIHISLHKDEAEYNVMLEMSNAGITSFCLIPYEAYLKLINAMSELDDARDTADIVEYSK